MVWFDRSCMTFYRSAIVTIDLSLPFSSYLTLNNRPMALKSGLEVTRLKLVPFESLIGAVSYSPSIVTMAVSIAVCEIYSVKNGVTLKTELEFVHQGH